MLIQRNSNTENSNSFIRFGQAKISKKQKRHEMKTLHFIHFLENQKFTDLFFLPVREAAAAAVPLLVSSMRAAAGAASYEVRLWLRVGVARLPG
jgi:hypothetical protein